MSRPKPQKAKLPVPVIPPKPPARPRAKAQPRKAAKPPAVPIGPVAAMARAIIDRIADIARGPYEAFVMLMTISGLVELHYATNPWPALGLVEFGMVVSLVARYLARRRS